VSGGTGLNCWNYFIMHRLIGTITDSDGRFGMYHRNFGSQEARNGEHSNVSEGCTEERN
jgi:hypothetical protein